MIKLSNIVLPLPYADAQLTAEVARILDIREDQIRRLDVIKQSIDARRKPNLRYIVTAALETDADALLVKHKKAEPYQPSVSSIEQLNPKRLTNKPRVVVVGSGPAGLFAALTLAEAGACPIVLERGLDADSRAAAVEKFFQTGELDERTNVQFGEGGAGTFSDGKLNTGTSSELISVVIGEFIRHGAPREIGYVNKPHIGTDYLRRVVKAMREHIEALGGSVMFDAKVTDFIVKDGAVKAVDVTGEKSFRLDVDACVLCIGHSARDTFETLYARGAAMEQKPFSVGVRIEHLQSEINLSQYGINRAGIPAADYKLSAQLPSGRGVYTFCMCPGGTVVAAASEQGGIVTNGMSEFRRDGANANAAVLVSVGAADFGTDHPLGGVTFQRGVEREAYRLTGSFRAPAQLLSDFMEGRATKRFGSVVPSYLPRVEAADLRAVFPSFVVDGVADGIRAFDRKLKGFATGDAVLTGPETRSSSPVRILRDDGYESSLRGLYPCGEGAGYAGGITSSAVDGIRTALKIIDKFTSEK